MGCGALVSGLMGACMHHRRRDELFGGNGLLIGIPFGLEVMDVFGESLQQAEIEPGGGPDNPVIGLDVGRVLGSHGECVVWLRWVVVLRSGWCQVSADWKEGECGS